MKLLAGGHKKESKVSTLWGKEMVPNYGKTSFFSIRCINITKSFLRTHKNHPKRASAAESKLTSILPWDIDFVNLKFQVCLFIPLSPRVNYWMTWGKKENVYEYIYGRGRYLKSHLPLKKWIPSITVSGSGDGRLRKLPWSCCYSISGT